MLVLKNARLLPTLTEGYDNQRADVLIEGNRIKELRPCGGSYEDCEILDLRGMTLLPGMFDLHMHMYFSSDNFSEVALRGHIQYVLDSIDYLHEFLRQGFTTVRDVGNPFYIGVAIRDAVAAGIITGPRILTAGRCITPFAKGNDTFPNLYYEVNTPQDVFSACRYEYAQGVDCFKYMATGAVANLTGVPGAYISSQKELNALQAAAEAMHTHAAVHCHGTEGILASIRAGVRTIEHASMIDETCIEELLRRNGHTTIVPTLNPVVQIHRDGGSMPPIICRKIDEVYSHTAQLVEATRAGVLTGWGTDTSLAFFRANPGFEFDARREVGYSNLEMLEQATINSARILGVEDCLGTIKAGKLADLVVINGNPDEDISTMMAYPTAVFKEGIRCF